MNVPLLTPTTRDGNLHCGSCNTLGAPPCGQPATWHIAWWFTPKADFSLVCDEHMTAAQAQFVYIDRHPAAVACNMPGTGWALAEPSYCVIPPDDDQHPTIAQRRTEHALETE